jgi:large subunit ribosomal protein L6
MSRVARNPLTIPKGVDISVVNLAIKVKSTKGALEINFPDDLVTVTKEDSLIRFEPKADVEKADAAAGTVRALVRNMIDGVTKGYERKLIMVGVGYRAAVQGKVLNISAGFSHPVKYAIPDGITIETPAQTEILIKGIDKQKVGQVAAEIRAYRPPEPYKGKGIRYEGEIIVLKEGKKK